MYDFDVVYDRRHTDCIKYDTLPYDEDLISLWIADMDFATPDFIVERFKKRIEHPVFGYPTLPEGYYETISEWVHNLHGWDVNPSIMRYIPGIVKGIGFVLTEFCKPGDAVLIQPPVYHPFRNVSEKHNLEVRRNPLVPVMENGRIVNYEMDFEGMERLLSDGKVKVMILANPHNPGGICWPRETLMRLAEITSRYGVLVISDEIHAEMALFGNRHIPYASVSELAASNSITFMAPSKTFNIAGIVTSYAIVPNEKLRERFFNFLDSNELDFPSIFSTIATKAAYTQGAQWRREMLSYVEGNIRFVEDFLSENCPEIYILRPQASFLVWMDCRGLGLPQDELVSLFRNKARLVLNDGSIFGEEGSGFMRLNVGEPRSILEEALRRLKKAI